jgi:hypothetical protein
MVRPRCHFREHLIAIYQGFCSTLRQGRYFEMSKLGNVVARPLERTRLWSPVVTIDTRTRTVLSGNVNALPECVKLWLDGAVKPETAAK